jgi:hypothetical protein
MSSDDGALEEIKGEFALTAEKKIGRDFILDFWIGIGQPTGGHFS